MRRSQIFFLNILVVFFILGTGCQSIGVKKRITEKQAVFDSLTSPQQKSLRSGFIQKGYTEDMVYIALGNPSEIESKDSPLGPVTTWIYKNYYPATDELTDYHAVSTRHNRRGLVSGEANQFQPSLSLDDEPVDTLYVVFIDQKVYGISLESQGAPPKF